MYTTATVANSTTAGPQGNSGNYSFKPHSFADMGKKAVIAAAISYFASKYLLPNTSYTVLGDIYPQETVLALTGAAASVLSDVFHERVFSYAIQDRAKLDTMEHWLEPLFAAGINLGVLFALNPTMVQNNFGMLLVNVGGVGVASEVGAIMADKYISSLFGL